MEKLDKKEWLLIAAVSLVVIFLTTLPIVIGIFYTPPGQIFLGSQINNFFDTPVYYSWIEQVKDGHFLFKNLYTGETHPRFLFDIFWLAVGLAAKFLSLSSFAAFQIVRIALIPMLLIVAYSLISFFFESKRARRWAFLMTTFSSGWGLIFLMLPDGLKLPTDSLIMDLGVVEANTFFSAYYSPHFIFSLTLILAIFFLTLKSWGERKLNLTIWAGGLSLILFQFHPYYVPTIFGVLGLYLLALIIKNKKLSIFNIKSYLVILLLSSPSIIYHLWTLKTFLIRQGHAAQNILPTPSILNFIFTYGAIFLLALLGYAYIIKKQLNDKNLFLLVWPIAIIFLIYNPLINYQRKLIQSVHAALSILAIFGVYYLINIYPDLKKYLKNTLLVSLLFIFLFTSSNIYIIQRDVQFYLGRLILFISPYISQNKKAAMEWAKTLPEGVFLAGYYNSNLLPAFALKQVYLGHWGMTANAFSKKEKVNWFFGQQATPEEQKKFLTQNKIKYIFYEEEKQMFPNFHPQNLPFLKEIYKNTEVKIYEIN